MPQQSAYEDLQGIAHDTVNKFKDYVTLKSTRDKASKWLDGAKQYISDKTTVSAKDDSPKSQTRKVSTAKTSSARKPVAKKATRKTTTKR